ncbi:MAG: Cystathionine gamma-synthase [Verrucomicrobiota bacterium]|jgi:cystathionine gamma-synthase
MRDVCGYEEKDPAIVAQLTSGYPRFVVHPFAKKLAAHFVATTPALAAAPDHGRAAHTLWLVTSARMAHALSAHLGGTGVSPVVFARDGFHGVAHAESPEIFARAKVFLQNRGGFVSSRAAEDGLVRAGLLAAPYAEEVFPSASAASASFIASDPAAEIRRHLRTALNATRPAADPRACTDADLLLAPCGMGAIWAAFRAAADLQAARGRTVWLQLGWLYLDTIALLKKFTAAPADYVYIRDVLDLAGLARLFAKFGPRLAGVIAEVPTNPLIQTPDLPALAALCRRHGALLFVDPSVVSVFNVDVLPHCDAVLSSLTKYTASAGDLTAGLVALNPAAPDAAELRHRIAAELEPVNARDLARLAWQIGRTAAVLEKIHASTARVAAFLAAHPAIAEVHWALATPSRENYLRLARAPDATGGMITFTLKKLGALADFYDRLRLPKGPSFGMTTTLICPFMYLAHYDLVTTPAGLAELAASKLDPDLLRLCIGTEPPDEIIAALAEALGACASN